MMNFFLQLKASNEKKGSIFGAYIKNVMLKKLCYTFILMLFTTVLSTAANTDFTGVSMREAAETGGIEAGEYTFSKYAGQHLNEVNLTGESAGMLKRPYMRSPLTIKSIMSTGEGIPDATWPGGFNWKVPGTFRGSEGIFQLSISPQTNVIYHFNFVH